MEVPQDTVLNGTVVVVGAGVAGLVTAHLLAEAGAKVVVVEKLDVLGGLARSFSYGDFTFDIGPHRFHTANPNIQAYLDRVLADQGSRFPRLSEVYFRGKYYRWPLRPANLTQLPKGMAARAFRDLALNGLKTYSSDTFQDYVLSQYGKTLYENFFHDYSVKFLGVHPRDTHPDWAKVGINRAVIDEKLQMGNLAQLAKTTFLTAKGKEETNFIYPTGGMKHAWTALAAQLRALGGKIILGTGARLEGSNGHIDAVWAGDERIECSKVVWTAPITLAMDQLGHGKPDLKFLGLLLYNVLVRDEAVREYQWCYFGQKDLVFNRISIPRYFCDQTVPKGMHGLCVEVTCMKDDARWKNAENLTDWVVDDLVRVGAVRNRRQVENVFVERVADSYPIYTVDYPGKLEACRKTLAQYDNLHLAGRSGLFWYNNMDHSIENAMQLSRKLLREAGQHEASEERLAHGRLSA